MTQNPAKLARLHPATSEKFRQRWTRTNVAFRQMDTDHDGRISADELKSALKRLCINLNADEFRDVWEIFDSDRSGTIDYLEFQTVISEILEGNADREQYKSTNGVSLNFSGPCSIKEPYRRPIVLDTTWNNKYRQNLDKGGDPLIAAMVRGDWYIEDRDARHSEVLAEKAAKTFFPPHHVQQWDKDGNMPEMSSLMLGRFYGDASKRHLSSKRDVMLRQKWIISNLKTPRNYGDWLHDIVSKAAQEPPSAAATPRSKRTRAMTAPGSARGPLRSLTTEELSDVRQDRAREFIQSRGGTRSQSVPRPASGSTKIASQSQAPEVSFSPRPPNSARTPRTQVEPDLQGLQRSTYRCVWAAPKADMLQKAWVSTPRSVGVN